jgi:hypothetical protein
MGWEQHVKKEPVMNEFHKIPGVNAVAAFDLHGTPDEALDLAEALYPDDLCHAMRAFQLLLMQIEGNVLPRMPYRLPSRARLEAMTATERAFCLMVHIASLALQIEMLRSGRHLPSDHSRPVKTRISNARRRLRRACRHAELSHLWRHGLWKIGALMLLVENSKQANATMRNT